MKLQGKVGNKMEGNVLEVTIAPNDDDKGRELKVGVQAGNAFDGFTFVQGGVSDAH